MNNGTRLHLWLLGTLLLCGSLRANDEPHVLTTVAEIRGLSAGEAAKGLPVRLRATVSFVSYGDGWFKVHDGEEGISVSLEVARKRGIWSGRSFTRADNILGVVLEIEGITGPGSYSPIVIPSEIRRVGTGLVPEARRVSMEQLISGSEVSQRVEVEGVVWGSRRLADGKQGLDLMVEGHLCEAEFMRDAGVQPDRLVDARVRVRGFSRPIMNFRSQAVWIRLTIPSIDDVAVLRPPPEDAFESPRVPLKDLLSFSRVPDRFHRKVTQGVVNFVMPGDFFFLQEGTAGVRVESASKNVQVGDLVEVAGFVDNSRSVAQFKDAVARRLGRAEVPPAPLVTVNQILMPGITRLSTHTLENDFAGGVVRLRGLVTEVEWRKRESLLNLFLVSDGHRFRTSLPATEEPPVGLWSVGSEVEVDGVCELELKLSGAGVPGTIVNDFSLWLRTPQDVRVLKAAPWWTPGRLGRTLGVVCVVLVLVLGWVGLLRRQVARQMKIISDKLRGEAVSTERNRIARDLHDTLEQQLAGVALQLDGAEDTIREDPVAASEAVILARQMLRHTRLEARRSVWDLRSQVLEKQGLPAALHALAESAVGQSAPETTVQVSGEYGGLPARVEFQLLRVAQESLANAIKHAGAKRVVITLESTPEATRLRISDDGRGFSPGALTRSDNSHFGVLGMQERAARIGAELSIVGTPGAGCVVTLNLPSDASPANHSDPI
jgi:signal transduction histidine kinase